MKSFFSLSCLLLLILTFNLNTYGQNVDTSKQQPVMSSEFVFCCKKIETESCIDSVVWSKYIRQSIKSVVDTISYRISPGEYEVEVLFLIDKNGTILTAQAKRGCDLYLSSLAEKIILKGPAWEPSTQNGKFTRSYQRQTIVFTIPVNSDCKELIEGNGIL